jgi:hypothetical protein
MFEFPAVPDPERPVGGIDPRRDGGCWSCAGALSAPQHLVALVRAGAKFEKGVLIERPDEVEHKVAT